MAAEAVRYVNSAPELDDGLRGDLHRLVCGQCDEEYRVHYSASESSRLEDHRYLAAERITGEHPLHSRTILL